MILLIVLFLTYGMLVSSNNGYLTIPAQTYPLYLQNGYANPSANQPCDVTPYLQSMVVQNQSPSLNISPSNVRQLLLNRILSGQPMQTIFDQNSSGYGSNLVEFPNNAIAPNAVNNYFASPMINEYTNNQLIGANKENKAQEMNTEDKRKKGKKRKSRSKRKHDKSENNHNSTRENEKANGLQENDKETSKKTRKRFRKPKTESSSHNNHTKNNENEDDKKAKKKKRKNKESDVKNPVEEETKVDKSKPRRRHKKKTKLDKYNNTNKVVSEQQVLTKPTQIQEGINLAHFNEGIVEENRVPRNPIPEGNDLFKAIPNLPENIANSFNFKGLPQFNDPAMSNFFANYENIYQSMLANYKGTNEKREIIVRKPKRKTNNRRKIGVKNKHSTVTAATVPSNLKTTASPKINIVTTEKTIYIKEKTLTNIKPITKKESLESIAEPSEGKESTINEFDNEEHEIKDIESNINDSVSNYGYIDDYYPQFADSAANTANNREVYIKNLGDTKYYYAVDKGNPDFINRMRFEGFGLPERITKDYEVNKKYDNVEKEGLKSALKPDLKDTKEDTIQFRSPPHLEIPDFQTRKVERSEINPDPYYLFDGNDNFDPRLGDKASIFSEVKIPRYAETKDYDKKLKDKHKDVETVFARSKVVSYGPVYNPEDDTTSAETSNQALTDDSYFKDGGTTFVMATSLDYPEIFR